jgi:hypothetical protein
MTARRHNLFWSLAALSVGGGSLFLSLREGLYHEPIHVCGIVVASVIIVWGILRLGSWMKSN